MKENSGKSQILKILNKNLKAFELASPGVVRVNSILNTDNS